MPDAQSAMVGDFTPSVSSPPSTREPEFLVHSEFERLAPPDAAWAPLSESSGGRNSPYSGSLGHVGENDEEMVGVGILMQQDPKDGALYVKSCVRGGAAARSGKIEEGDRIVSVDGQSCADTPVSQAREMIVGIQGTTVRISFIKPQGDHYQCLLTRGTAEYLEQISSASTSQLQVSRTEALLKSANLTLERLQRSAPAQPSLVSPREEEGNSKMRGENEKLRLRNTELEMEVSNLQSVVVRLQQQIDFERGSAKSVSHEVELIQKKYSDQIRDLHNMLNESEKARRDAELQLSLQQKRESVIHDTVQKAKEQAEQREQYYTDLCNKLEEERNDYESLCNQEKSARICSEDERRQAEQALERMMKEVDRIKSAERRRREMEERLLKRMVESEGRLQEAKAEEERVRMHSIENAQIFTQWQNDFFSNKTSQEAEVDSYFLA